MYSLWDKDNNIIGNQVPIQFSLYEGCRESSYTTLIFTLKQYIYVTNFASKYIHM